MFSLSLQHINHHLNKVMSKFIILDWMGNHKFNNIIFDSFEDGWDFLYVTFPGDDSYLDDFYVTEVTKDIAKKYSIIL